MHMTSMSMTHDIFAINFVEIRRCMPGATNALSTAAFSALEALLPVASFALRIESDAFSYTCTCPDLLIIPLVLKLPLRVSLLGLLPGQSLGVVLIDEGQFENVESGCLDKWFNYETDAENIELRSGSFLGSF